MQVEIKQVTCSVAPSGPDWYADVSSAAVVAERKRITLSSLVSFYLIVVRGKAPEVR